MTLREATVSEIADLLHAQKDDAPRACLLIGAGVSYTAGIGLSSHFVERIKSEYPAAYDRAFYRVKFGDQPSYADCMAALPLATQAKLVRDEVENARINWAHIGIARMEKAGRLGAILTTNFDPLASRACALFNRFPAVYDLASLRDRDGDQPVFDASLIRSNAIFHLHGQHTGFLVLNTTGKLANQAARIRPVLSAVLKGRPVIVAGYSGENDPLVNEIAKMAPFNHGLFWVCHDYKDPAPNVMNSLLSLDNCYVVRNNPSDKFFTHLATALKIPMPLFLTAPFEHFRSIINTLKPYDDVGDLYGDNVLQSALDDIEAADNFIGQKNPFRREVRDLITTGQYQTAIDRFASQASTLDSISRAQIAWAATSLGNETARRARIALGLTANKLFAKAYKLFLQAVSINPDMYEAYDNWAGALAAHARTEVGPPAYALFREADEKFSIAVGKQPKACKTIMNWGTVLSIWASGTTGQEADRLYELAYSKFAQSISSPNCHFHTLINWGNALATHARMKHGTEALVLLEAACQKWNEAHGIKGGDADILYFWGSALMDRAKICTGSESLNLFDQAYKKLTEAEKLTPGIASYNLSCLKARQGDTDEAIKWLRIAKNNMKDFPNCLHIANDSDFNSIRTQSLFQSVLREIGC